MAAISGAGLVAVLGWCTDDFESALREASGEEIQSCITILEQADPPGTPEHMVQRGRAGLMLAQAALSERNE